MRRTLRRNLLKAWLAYCQFPAVSGLTFWILIFKGSADGSSRRAYLNSQGLASATGFQQESVCFQLLVKACKLSWVVLKVRVKNKSGLLFAIPSKLASILSLKIVPRVFI